MTDRESPFDTLVSSFAPKTSQAKLPTAAEIDKTSTFPVRQASAMPATEPTKPKGMIGINTDHHIIERFKKMCKDDRRSYGDMLERLMNRYEDIPNTD